MRVRCNILSAGALLVWGLADAQQYQLGQALSAEILAQLVRPTLLSPNIAVVHIEAGSAMVIDSSKPHGSIVYLRGSSFLWAQIGDQLPAATAQDKPIHLEFLRWTLDPGSCPMLGAKVDALLVQLEEVISNPIKTNALPEQLVVDGPTFHILVAAKDALLTVTPAGLVNPPLQQAAGELHSTVSGCANSLKPVEEQHDF